MDVFCDVAIAIGKNIGLLSSSEVHTGFQFITTAGHLMAIAACLRQLDMAIAIVRDGLPEQMAADQAVALKRGNCGVCINPQGHIQANLGWKNDSSRLLDWKICATYNEAWAWLAHEANRGE